MKNVITTKKYIRTIDKIVTPVSCKYGAPMGRHNFIQQGSEIKNGTDNINVKYVRISGDYWIRLYDCAVPMSNDGAYDRGGAYWGIGKQLRVQYTKDLSYVRFYRLGDTE
jgi:hypothetical protein